jgi:hypothetical protein
VSDDSLVALVAAAPPLSTLRVCLCRHITDRGLLAVTTLRTLTDLDVSYCAALTDLTVRLYPPSTSPYPFHASPVRGPHLAAEGRQREMRCVCVWRCCGSWQRPKTRQAKT